MFEGGLSSPSSTGFTRSKSCYFPIVISTILEALLFILRYARTGYRMSKAIIKTCIGKEHSHDLTNSHIAIKSFSLMLTWSVGCVRCGLLVVFCFCGFLASGDFTTFYSIRNEKEKLVQMKKIVGTDIKIYG